MDGSELLQRLREQRLTTLLLADQVPEERWREPAIAGGWSIHDLLSHLLAWDEWAIGVFEISALRELPQSLKNATKDPVAFNARAIQRFKIVLRDDMISSLQNASNRVVSGAQASGGTAWAERHIADLAPSETDTDEAGTDKEHVKASRGPSVASILRSLLRHEERHAQEISAAFGITASLDELRNRANPDQR